LNFAQTEDIELKSSIGRKESISLSTGRSKRDHPASVVRKKVTPVFETSTYQSLGLLKLNIEGYLLKPWIKM